MALITLLDAQLAFGHVPLLDHAGFSLEPAERVGLIGRNGAGKSSMLKILAGMEKPDDGVLQVQSNTRIAYVAQEPSLDAQSTVFESVSVGLQRVRHLIEEYCQGHGDDYGHAVYRCRHDIQCHQSHHNRYGNGYWECQSEQRVDLDRYDPHERRYLHRRHLELCGWYELSRCQRNDDQ